MPKMDDDKLRAIIDARVRNALGWQGGLISKERRKAERYYRGEPFGNEMDGRSQVVSRVVAEAVDSMLPPLLKIFAAGDQIVTFEPVYKAPMPGQDPTAAVQMAEQQAKQATDYVNWIWEHKNKAYKLFSWWFKDALLFKVGWVKVWWEESENFTTETYNGLTDLELQMLTGNEDVELVSKERSAVVQMGPGMSQAMAGWDVEIKRTQKKGHVCVANIPPEEVLTERRAVDPDEFEFIAHRRRMTASDLLALYPEKKALIDDLPSDQTYDFNMEVIERFKDDDEFPYRPEGMMDPSTRPIWVVESYIKVDYDGDGLAEMRKVTTAGNASDASGAILDNEVVDDHPFCPLSPIMMPHKLFGQSIADQTMDLQLVQSALWRGVMDSIYLSLSPQVGVMKGQVNLDQLMQRRPGQVVEMKSPGAIEPIPVQPVGAEAFEMIQYIDSMREQRTGVQRFTAGPGADALQNAYSGTATGASIVENASQERLEYIARTFAETGVKRAFRRTLELVCRYQKQREIIRLRNTWVPIDPSEWNDQMDLTINTGLGTGNKQQQITTLANLLNIDKGIVEMQGGVQGPLLTAENIYHKLTKLAEASGLKNVEIYYTDPKTVPPPQPKPDPKLQEAQMKAQAQAQTDELKAHMTAQTDIVKALIAAGAQIDTARMKAGLDMAMSAQQQEMDLYTNAQQAVSGQAQQQPQQPTNPDDLNGTMTQALQALQQSTDAIGQAVQHLGRPKQIVRDQMGRAIGVQ